MDPNATVRLFIAAIHDHDLELAKDCESNYRRWLLRGGFPAKITKGLGYQSVSVLDAEMMRIGVCNRASSSPTTDFWVSVEQPCDVEVCR